MFFFIVTSWLEYSVYYFRLRPYHNDLYSLQGDHLIAQCVYNSEGRSTITLGGLTTREEMCLVFALYYPRIDMSLCHSLPSLPTVLHSLGIQELWPWVSNYLDAAMRRISARECRVVVERSWSTFLCIRWALLTLVKDHVKGYCLRVVWHVKAGCHASGREWRNRVSTRDVSKCLHTVIVRK